MPPAKMPAAFVAIRSLPPQMCAVCSRIYSHLNPLNPLNLLNPLNFLNLLNIELSLGKCLRHLWNLEIVPHYAVSTFILIQKESHQLFSAIKAEN